MACACGMKKTSKSSSIRQVTKRTPVSRSKAIKKTVKKRIKRPMY